MVALLPINQTWESDSQKRGTTRLDSFVAQVATPRQESKGERSQSAPGVGRGWAPGLLTASLGISPGGCLHPASSLPESAWSLPPSSLSAPAHPSFFLSLSRGPLLRSSQPVPVGQTPISMGVHWLRLETASSRELAGLCKKLWQSQQLKNTLVSMKQRAVCVDVCIVYGCSCVYCKCVCMCILYMHKHVYVVQVCMCVCMCIMCVSMCACIAYACAHVYHLCMCMHVYCTCVHVCIICVCILYMCVYCIGMCILYIYVYVWIYMHCVYVCIVYLVCMSYVRV